MSILEPDGSATLTIITLWFLVLQSVFSNCLNRLVFETHAIRSRHFIFTKHVVHVDSPRFNIMASSEDVHSCCHVHQSKYNQSDDLNSRILVDITLIAGVRECNVFCLYQGETFRMPDMNIRLMDIDEKLWPQLVCRKSVQSRFKLVFVCLNGSTVSWWFRFWSQQRAYWIYWLLKLNFDSKAFLVL